MTPNDPAMRIRGEYAEMPGLRLTVPQACRLWQIDRDLCESLLDRLVRERFLFRTADGAFVMFPAPRPAKAQARDSEAFATPRSGRTRQYA
jgi:hypothetical protein